MTTRFTYEAVPGPCATCGQDDVCCDHRGKPYCHDCWHSARYREVPYVVARDGDGYVFGSAKLKEEAEAHAAEMTVEDQRVFDLWVKSSKEDPREEVRKHYAALIEHAVSFGLAWRRYKAVEARCWFGDRTAHPAYMARRRAAVLAAHPEHAPPRKLSDLKEGDLL